MVPFETTQHCTSQGVSQLAFGFQVGTFYLQSTANFKTNILPN
jgi:hypothetical protein